MTRRQLLAATAASAAVLKPASHAQTAAATPDWAKAAREANQRNAEALVKVEVPIATEPAFAFKA